ncbi:MAG: glycosyltransferase family 39 protein, partial [Solirubrobacteraceae bacterium]
MRALAALLLLAAALRFPTLGEQSFWRDEASTALELHGGLGHLWSGVRDLEGMPPGYFLLAWVWSKAFGLGEVGLRSLSALIGVATVGVAWALGAHWSPRAGRLAAAFAATSPFLVWYAQEARPYALLVLATATATLFLVRGRVAAWGLAAAAALLTHYFAVFLLVPQALVLLRRHGRGAVPGLAPPVVVGLALTPLALSQRDNGVDWVSGSALAGRVADVAKHWGSGAFGTPVDAAGALALALLVAGMVGALASGRGGRVVATAAAAIAVPVVLALAGADYVLDRYLIAALVPLLAVVTAGFGTRRGTVGTAGGARPCPPFPAFPSPKDPQ